MLGQELRASYALAYQTGDALPLASQFSLGTRSAGAVHVPSRARPLRGDAAINGVPALAGEANRCKSYASCC